MWNDQFLCCVVFTIMKFRNLEAFSQGPNQKATQRVVKGKGNTPTPQKLTLIVNDVFIQNIHAQVDNMRKFTDEF